MYYDVDKIVDDKGFGKSRVISGTILSAIDRMAETQIENWEAIWEEKVPSKRNDRKQLMEK